MTIGIFGTLQIAKEALFTNQTSIAVTSNNIANVNTPGYSRQSPVIETWDSQTVDGLVFGRGSKVTDITKSYDQFINNSIIAEKSVLGWWEAKESSMSQVESIFNESNGRGINELLNDFWNSWNDIADAPESMAERTIMQADGQSLSAKFNKMVFDLESIQSDANQRIANVVDEINNITDEIASLNNQILSKESQGSNANSLTDERSLRVEELSKLLDIQVLNQNNNQLTILTVSGQALVADNNSWDLAVQIDPDNSNFYSIQHFDKGITRDLTNRIMGGELKGLLDIRDTDAPAYLDKLDFMAASLITEINRLHYQGYGLDGSTGNYFFEVNNISLENDYNNTGGGNIYDAQITDPAQLVAGNFEIKFLSGTPQDSKYEIYDVLNEEYLFNIDAGSSALVFEELGNDKLISIDQGTYTGKELAAEIEKKMDEAAEDSALAVMDYSVTYDEDGRTFTFKNLGNSASTIEFSNIDTTISEILGFDETDVILDPIDSVSSDTKSGVYSYAAQLIEIDSGSNESITFEVNLGGDLTATLTSGIYTPDELAAELETQLDIAHIAAGGAGNFSVQFDNLTQEFEITNNTGVPVDFKFTNSSAASSLNFDNTVDQSVAAGNTIMSDDPRYAERQFDIITGTNDEIHFTDGGIDPLTDVIAIIPEGNYTGEELAAKIEKQMEATKGSSGQDYSVSFDTVNGYFRIANKSSNLHDLNINWTNSPGAAATLGYAIAPQNIAVGLGETSTVTVGDVAAYDTIELYGMSFKLTDLSALPKRGDVFKISTIKDAAQDITMDEVTASDTDKIAAALYAIDIDGSNNTIIYDDDGNMSNNRDADGNLVDGNYKEIVIPTGRYTPEELAAEIERLLEENTPGDSYAVEFDMDTHKFSIMSNPSNANPVTFMWEAEETTAEFTLGFSTEVFTITENVNDQMEFTEGVLPASLITLEPGSYTGDQMASEIEKKMNDTLTQDYYEVSYDNYTRAFTITNPDVDDNNNTLNTLDTVLDWTSSTITENTAVTLGFNSGDTENITLNSSTVSDYTPGQLDPSGATSVLKDTSDFAVAEIQVGDNRNAINITDVRDQEILANGSLTFDAYYNILTGEIGSDVAETNRGVEHQEYMVTQYEERRTSIAGVSIDEEMINLIKFQQSYAVSAKLVSTLDDMLNTLINLR